jgi:hypothetical protein
LELPVIARNPLRIAEEGRDEDIHRQDDHNETGSGERRRAGGEGLNVFAIVME